MDDDNIAHQTGDSLGAMIRKVIKIDTHRINVNMVDYLRVGIILGVTKPIRSMKTGSATFHPKGKNLCLALKPPAVLAADKADASTNEDGDDAAVVAAEEGVTLPTTPSGSPVNLNDNGNATIPLAAAPT
ncbi:hypothetical protein V6N13_140175 [Hibiscus sabdariffa]|uniref:Uncharacterized protein n=1 Tax=Hibiscus sabdariffa TaxID=183260 RepID=A0ABR2QAX8_9ROSI